MTNTQTPRLLELENEVSDLKSEIDDMFCELRGLLKEHALFQEQWDTNERLIEWLKSRNQYSKE